MINHANPARRSYFACAAFIALAALSGPFLHGATACGDKFRIRIKSIVFDGLPVDTVMLQSRTVTIATGSFGRWRPDEERESEAALTLIHQDIPEARVDICPVIPPDLPTGEVSWKKYVADAVVMLGEGTVASRVTDTTSPSCEGGRILEWDTREALLIRPPANGGKARAWFHLMANDAKSGIRCIVSAPSDQIEEAIMDLRTFLNYAFRPDSSAPSS